MAIKYYKLVIQGSLIRLPNKSRVYSNKLFNLDGVSHGELASSILIVGA